MKCFHRTPHGQKIIDEGICNGEGTYMSGHWLHGVWLSNRPLTIHEGAKGRDLLLLEIPDDLLAVYEWIEEGNPYREFLMPANLVNSFGPPKLVAEFETEWDS